MRNKEINLNKDYFTIGEVSDILNIDQHVIRFWSDKFSEYIKPLLKAGGRRNFSKKDLDLLTNIKDLLYTKGISIKGVQLLLDKNPTLNGASVLNEGSSYNLEKMDLIISKLQNISKQLAENIK